jgi:hypothetical protein
MRGEIDAALDAEGISLAQFGRSAIESRLRYSQQISHAIPIERHPEWPKHRRVLHWNLLAMRLTLQALRAAQAGIVELEPDETRFDVGEEMAHDTTIWLNDIDRRIRRCVNVVREEPGYATEADTDKD